MAKHDDTTRIDLTFINADIALQEIIRQYWELNDASEFAVTVESLKKPLAALGIRQLIYTLIRKHARATLPGLPCASCGEPHEVTSRTHYQELLEKYDRSEHEISCPTCVQKEVIQRRQEVAAKQQAEQQALRQRVADYVQGNHAEENADDYDYIPYGLCLKLMAYDAWSGYKLASGDAPVYHQPGITPTVSSDYDLLSTLFQKGLIYPVPVRDVQGFWIKDDNLSWRHDQVRYELVPHLSGSTQDALSIINDRQPQSMEEVTEVWFETAVQACIAYLDHQIAGSGLHSLDADESAAVAKLLSTAVRHYSVAQIRSLLWRCVKDAAALCAKPYYNVAKASATLLGKIDRAILAARDSQANLPDYRRPQNNPISEIELVFSRHFGITETTPPTELTSLLAPHLAPTEDDVIDDPELDAAFHRLLGESYEFMSPSLTEACQAVAWRLLIQTLGSDDEAQYAHDLATVRRAALKRFT